MRYLFKRKGSDNWYVRLQPPGQKLVERSLGTSDLKAAELAAADIIKQHKAVMYQRRQARVARVVHGPWAHEFEPGLHTLPDGRTLIATATDLTYSDGTRRPNGGPMIYLTGASLSAAREFKAFDDAWDGKIGEGPVPIDRPKFVAAKSSADDALIETYIAHAGLNTVRTKQARALWATFRSVIDKPLAKCTRDDGRALVAHLEAQTKGIKAATLRRYLVPLVALINLAIDEGKHNGINPFVGVVADRNDFNRRVPFDDADMKLIRANLHKLNEHDQLLVRVLATMGVRRGEAFAIAGEQVEKGVRFCMVGTKTEQSLRRVPFPTDLLAHLPKKITKPLFTGRMDNAGKRLSMWLRDIGISNPQKAPMHSFRHRAQDRLRAAGCPSDIREELLGHERKTVAAGYGKGSPVPLLRKWLDRIGF